MRERILSKKPALETPLPRPTAMGGQGRGEGVLVTQRGRNIFRKMDELSVRCTQVEVPSGVGS